MRDLNSITTVVITEMINQPNVRCLNDIRISPTSNYLSFEINIRKPYDQMVIEINQYEDDFDVLIWNNYDMSAINEATTISYNQCNDDFDDFLTDLDKILAEYTNAENYNDLFED